MDCIEHSYPETGERKKKVHDLQPQGMGPSVMKSKPSDSIQRSVDSASCNRLINLNSYYNGAVSNEV